MNKDKKTKIFLDVGIGILLVVYIVMTTMLFVNHKKISKLRNLQNGNEVSQTGKQKSKISEQSLLKKIEDNPQDTNSKKTLASHYYRQGDTQSSIKYYENILEHEPENIDIHFKLGLLLMGRQEQEHKAIKHFKRVLDLDPQNKRIVSILSWVKNLRKKRKKVLLEKKDFLTKMLGKTRDERRKEHFEKMLSEVNEEMKSFD